MSNSKDTVAIIYIDKYAYRELVIDTCGASVAPRAITWTKNKIAIQIRRKELKDAIVYDYKSLVLTLLVAVFNMIYCSFSNRSYTRKTRNIRNFILTWHLQIK